MLALSALGSAQPAAVLAVSGDQLHLDGRPVFLRGVSLFDALGSMPPRVEDLDAMQSWGVNTVRVWAHWHEPIYDRSGNLTADGRARLVRLAERLRGRSMILELVLLRPGQLPGQPFALFESEAARGKAVEAITVALRPYRNILFDLHNEHDHSDGPISHAAARVLRDIVKANDRDRVVTISSTEQHLVSAAGVSGEREENLRQETGEGPGAVGVDVVAPHFPRTDDWARATRGRVGILRAALDRIGRRVPIYLNEERRAEAGERVAPEDYDRAMRDARAAGAAGWVFHTAAGFDLKKVPFLDALLPGERAGLQRLRAQ